jgi:hypothetical protein
MYYSFSLSWGRFAIIAIVMSAVPAFLLPVIDSGNGDPETIAIIVMWLSVIAFFGHRWHRMRQEFFAGSFTESDYFGNPLKYIVGPLLVAGLWFAGTLFLTVSIVVIWVLRLQSA